MVYRLNTLGYHEPLWHREAKTMTEGERPEQVFFYNGRKGTTISHTEDELGQFKQIRSDLSTMATHPASPSLRI